MMKGVKARREQAKNGQTRAEVISVHAPTCYFA
jgi:hypothetical protein